MLVVDGNEHEVYEVNDECVWQSPRSRVVSLSFDEFETLSCNPSGLVRAGPFANILEHRQTIVALKLHDSGFAWGSRIAVQHKGELPDVPCAEFGGDLLVLWPAAMSIHAFFELKEERRREAFVGVGTGGDTADDPYPPKPSVSVMPHDGVLGAQDLPVVRKLDTAELTVAQRIFLACLPPTGIAFQPRQHKDRWVAVMEQRDENEYQQLPIPRYRRQKRKRVPRCWWATAVPQQPQTSGAVALDLPDEVLMHIVSMHLCQEMATASTIQSAVATLLHVSPQFGRATRQAMAAMQQRVRTACLSLCDERPAVSVAHVRLLLEGVYLPLRAALRLRGPWYEYIRARRDNEEFHAQDGRSHVELARAAHTALTLFGVTPPPRP